MTATCKASCSTKLNTSPHPMPTGNAAVPLAPVRSSRMFCCSLSHSMHMYSDSCMNLMAQRYDILGLCSKGLKKNMLVCVNSSIWSALLLPPPSPRPGLVNFGANIACNMSHRMSQTPCGRQLFVLWKSLLHNNLHSNLAQTCMWPQKFLELPNCSKMGLEWGLKLKRGSFLVHYTWLLAAYVQNVCTFHRCQTCMMLCAARCNVLSCCRCMSALPPQGCLLQRCKFNDSCGIWNMQVWLYSISGSDARADTTVQGKLRHMARPK